MEVCVESLESVINAFKGNANRVELCSSLIEGGLTPSYGLYRSIRNYLDNNDPYHTFGVNVMIRCRGGEFNYNDNEIDTMIEDLNKFVELECDGLVFGALDPYGYVDESLMKQFLKLIPSNIKTTFHRAFDVCVDWKKCYNQIEDLGFNKLLTSGQKVSAYEGKDLIKQLVEMSEQSEIDNRNSVKIIAGAGINSKNLDQILKETKCKEFHASCRSSRDSNMAYRNTKIQMGAPNYDEYTIKFTDKKIVKELSDIFNKYL